MSNDSNEDRYYDYLAAGGDPRSIISGVPKGKISEKTLEKLSVYPCKGYRVGRGTHAKTYLCPDRAILWRNYGRVKYGLDIMASEGRCKGCEEKHDHRPCCNSRHCCDDV